MAKIIFIAIILSILFIIGCEEQPIKPEPVIEEPEQVCTEMWLCQDENTKAHRKSDCTFEQITDCPAGCENGECKEVVEEPQLEEPEEKPKESCTIGWKCVDENKKGYMLSNCLFDNIDKCEYGCKDGECIKTPPKKEETKQEFSLTKGTGEMNDFGWKSFDFSENQIFEEGIYKQDFKLYLYAKSSGYTHFKVESQKINTWVIEKRIADATRSDCTEKILDANSYNYLNSEQTLCIQTVEKDIALIGGYWDGTPKEDTKLYWKYYTPK